jgi:broad specificity phosphatase PhoE
MAKFLFVRHGEADYSHCLDRGFIGLGIEMAQLSDKGIEQIKSTSTDTRLQGADLLISSPYTRALQSASIIASSLSMDIHIEVDVHEWMPDKSFQCKNDDDIDKLHSDFEKHKGLYPVGETRLWEDCLSVKKRALNVLEKYKHLEKVIVVCHGYLISMTTNDNYENVIKNGEIIEFIYD